MSLRFSKEELSENNIQIQCIDWLRIKRWYILENYKNKKPRVRGISDIAIMKNGRTIWVEFKTKVGKQSKEQIEFELNVKNHGCEYIIIRSLEDLFEYFGEEKQGEFFNYYKGNEIKN
jgi:hypothetical protein